MAVAIATVTWGTATLATTTPAQATPVTITRVTITPVTITPVTVTPATVTPATTKRAMTIVGKAALALATNKAVMMTTVGVVMELKVSLNLAILLLLQFLLRR